MASTGEAWRLGHRPGRRPAFIVLALLAVLPLLAAFRLTAAPVDDPYLWFADEDFVDKFDAQMVDGIPQAIYRYKGETEPRGDNPYLVAAWGLEHYSRGDTVTALRAADWLVDQQQPGGVWRYDFEWWTMSGERLTPGWVSGLAQGAALSLLTRAWEVTGDQVYLSTAKAALAPFSRTVEDGGVLRFWRGRPFYEEYPTVQPSLVLNGFLFALIGLREYGKAASDGEALRLWRQGEQTAAAIIDEYSVGAHDSAYSLAYRYHDQAPHLVSTVPDYPRWHYKLARAMYDLTGRPVYARVAARWEPNVPPSPWPAVFGLFALLAAACAVLVLVVRRGVRRLGDPSVSADVVVRDLALSGRAPPG